MTGVRAEFDTFADFADGQIARLHRVGVNLSLAGASNWLVITLPDGNRLTWPLDALRCQPDQADPSSLVLAHAPDPVARLFLRDAKMIAQIKAHAPRLKRRPPVHNKGKLLAWASGAIASVALIIFVLVPVMADQLAEFLPPEGEQALGDATFEQIRTALSGEFGPVRICEDGAGAVALDRMRKRLNAEVDLPYPLRVNVLDHDMINAFALPGGRVVLFRGLIDAAETPEEVAAVLAHEIGHVAHRDPTRDALRAAGSIGVLGLLFGDFAGGTVVLFLANQLINASYSRSAEAAADEYAHAVLTRAGVSPGALGSMFQRLRDEYGDEEGIVAHFASHPQLAERIQAARVAASSASGADGLILQPEEWQALRGICGPERALAPDDGNDGQDDIPQGVGQDSPGKK